MSEAIHTQHCVCKFAWLKEGVTDDVVSECAFHKDMRESIEELDRRVEHWRDKAKASLAERDALIKELEPWRKLEYEMKQFIDSRPPVKARAIPNLFIGQEVAKNE